MTSDLLTQLRDIHYPSPISVWPLTFGWYLLLAIVLVGVLMTCYFSIQRIYKTRLKKIVLQKIDELEMQDASDSNVAEQLSMLLKRAALAIYPRNKVAGLHGEAWLQFLDETAMTDEFTRGQGRLLLTYPYQKNKDRLPRKIFTLIKQWVKKNL